MFFFVGVEQQGNVGIVVGIVFDCCYLGWNILFVMFEVDNLVEFFMVVFLVMIGDYFMVVVIFLVMVVSG